MKKNFLFIIFIFGTIFSFSQQDTTKLQTDSSLHVFKKNDVESTFPKGIKGWNKYLVENIRTICSEGDNKNVPSGEYQVTIKFAVDEDGSARVINIESNPENSWIEKQCSEMITRSPKWRPGMYEG